MNAFMLTSVRLLITSHVESLQANGGSMDRADVVVGVAGPPSSKCWATVCGPWQPAECCSLGQQDVTY